jgi:hypothetical protein
MEDYTIKIGTIEDWKKENEKVYDRILEKMSDINTSYEWYDFIIDEYTHELEKIGFRDIKIAFSGFYSQGDGANFTGNWCSITRKMENSDIPCIQELKILLEKIGKNHDWNFSIKKGYGSFCSHYSHENTISTFDADFFHVGKQCRESIGEKLEDEILAACRKVMKEIYHTLDEEYTNLTSEGTIYDTCMVNEYKFDSEGKIRQ